MKIQTSLESQKNFERPHIEEGLYEAELKEVKDISDGQYGSRVAFIFHIEKEKIDLSHITYVPEIATPENKFGKVLQSLGCELGNEIDTETLIGKKVRVMVEDYTFEEDSKKKTASSVSKVKPLG